MNKIVLGSAFAVMASFASGAAAQDSLEGGYVGLNYAFVTYEEDGISEDFDPVSYTHLTLPTKA